VRAEAAKRLALEVSAQTNALVAFAEDSARPDRRAEKRILPAPVALDD
jgi:hypothetical protein